MRSSRTITLFSDRPDPSAGSSAFFLSILMHGVVIGLVSLGVMYAPKMDARLVAEHFTVRHLDLHMPTARARRGNGGNIAYPRMRNLAHKPAPGGKLLAQIAAMQKTAKEAPGPQTLVQPDLEVQLMPDIQIPVPTVVIWSPSKIRVKTIVPPAPEKPTAAETRPSIELPNQEVNLADVGIAATDLSLKTPLVLPSTTSPVVVHGPEVQLPPVTTSDSHQQATPTAVLSVSDLKMPEGTVTLPTVNETASANSTGELSPGKAQETSQPGSGNPASSGEGAGAGQGANEAKADPPANPDPAGADSKAKAGKDGAAQGSDTGSGMGDQPSAEHITLPRDGQFGAVVVGDALEDAYPETAGVWSGRLAYTVYLHVGLSRNWILQYSLPASADAAAGGNVSRLEAPWPFNIVRPNLAPGAINADALMVHGFVNQAGRFEALSIAFPPEFPLAQFLVGLLEQWQFRPATQNGQNVKVEVLLIIPEELQ